MKTTESVTAAPKSGADWKYILKSFGPGIILAATAIGPGSILSGSTTGSRFGYSLVWWMVVVLFFRGMYQYSSMRYGVATGKSIVQGIRDRFGKGWAVAAGIFSLLSFVIYSVGNFTGIGLGLNILFPAISLKVSAVIGMLVAIGVLLLKGLYSKFETIMKVLVGMMIATFLVSLIMAGISEPGEIVRGLVPSVPTGSFAVMLSLLGTSASLAACAYASSLTKEKGWTTKDINNGMIKWDTIIGMISIGAITLLVMFVSAEVLRGSPIKSGPEFANALAGILGFIARPLVGIGLFAAAFSSLIGAPKIGINMLLQSLGKEGGMDSKLENYGCIAVILICSAIGLLLGGAPVELIILAQIGSIISTPLLGVMILLLINHEEMGEFRASKPFTGVLALTFAAIMYTVVNNVITLLS